MAEHPLFERYHDEVSKLAYFLQGVSASAIAFALHETANRAPSFSLVVIGIAVAIWGASFAAGVLFWHSIQVAMKANIAMNLMERGEGAKERHAEAEAQFQRYNRRGGIYYRILSWGLLAGALVYSTGHVVHLFEQQPARPAATPAASQPSSHNEGSETV